MNRFVEYPKSEPTSQRPPGSTRHAAQGLRKACFLAFRPPTAHRLSDTVPRPLAMRSAAARGAWRPFRGDAVLRALLRLALAMPPPAHPDFHEPPPCQSRPRSK